MVGTLGGFHGFFYGFWPIKGAQKTHGGLSVVLEKQDRMGAIFTDQVIQESGVSWCIWK